MGFKNFTSTGFARGDSIGVDTSGNTYVIGCVEGNLTVRSISFILLGSEATFLLKVDSAGVPS